MSLLSAYQDLITSQHRGKPKYTATVTALLKHSTDIYACAVYLDDDFDLDAAVGAQENILGEIVGQSRQMPFELITTGESTLNNEDYRVLLKAKIAKNLWKGGISDLEDTWQNLFGNRIKIQDNQDMTIEVQLTDVPTVAVQELILRGQVVPKPQSVGIKYNVIRALDGTVYFTGGLAQHKRYEIWPARPTDQDITTQIYVGGAGSMHWRYEVSQEPPTDQESTVTAYFGAVGARYKKYVVTQQTEEE